MKEGVKELGLCFVYSRYL